MEITRSRVFSRKILSSVLGHHKGGPFGDVHWFFWASTPFSLNFGVITLITKVQDRNRIEQYIQIFLLNVSFKIFTKVATVQVNSIADSIIGPTQTAFMKGWNILDGVVIILHQTVHELHRKNQSGVIFRLTLKKPTTKYHGHSYDKHFGWKAFHLIDYLRCFPSYQVEV